MCNGPVETLLTHKDTTEYVMIKMITMILMIMVIKVILMMIMAIMEEMLIMGHLMRKNDNSDAWLVV